MFLVPGTARVIRRGMTVLAAVALTAGGSASAAAAASSPGTAHAAVPPHVMVIWLENADYSQMAASPAMPELNQVARSYADFTRAYGWVYPSLPNYVELLAGSTVGITGDCDITDPGCSNLHHERIIDQLEAAGIPWHASYHGDASGCDQSDGSGDYPYWHTSAEQCYAVGLATSDLDEGVLVSITRGRPRSVTPLPAFIGLYGIACPAADTCYAVGYDNADDAGSVTTITNGQASAPAEVPDGGYTPWLNAISCPTPTQCYAAGLVNYLPSIVPITAGTPQAAVTVPDAWYLSGIDCPAAGSCVAVGENSTEQGIVTTLAAGQASPARLVAGTGCLYGVGCAAGGSCLPAGASPVSTSSFGSGVLVPYVSGAPLDSRIIPGSSGLGQTVCGRDLSNCVSAGAVAGR